MRRLFVSVVAASLLFAVAANAEDAPGGGQGWSVLSGKTVGSGNTFLHAQAGWPGVSASLLHGMTPTVDIGGRFTFDYGFEGDFSSSLIPALKIQGLSRFNIMDNGKMNFGIEFNPGFGIYFFPGVDLGPFGTVGGGAKFGITLPVNFVLGIPVSSAVMAHAGLDIPLFFTFGDGGVSALPLLFGGGFEYFIDQNMAFTFKLRMGPSIRLSSPTGADFAGQVLAGLALRI